MKNYKAILVFISSMLFGNLAFSVEGIAVIDYNAIFLGTELARERIDDLRDSSDYKELTDEAQSKDSERIKLAERLKKDLACYVKENNIQDNELILVAHSRILRTMVCTEFDAQTGNPVEGKFKNFANAEIFEYQLNNTYVNVDELGTQIEYQTIYIKGNEEINT